MYHMTSSQPNVAPAEPIAMATDINRKNHHTNSPIVTNTNTNARVVTSSNTNAAVATIGANGDSLQPYSPDYGLMNGPSPGSSMSSGSDSNQSIGLGTIYHYVNVLAEDNKKLKDTIIECNNLMAVNSTTLTEYSKQIQELREYNLRKVKESKLVVVELRDSNTDLTRKLNKIIEQNDALSKENKKLIEQKYEVGRGTGEQVGPVYGPARPTVNGVDDKPSPDKNSPTNELSHLRRHISQLEEKLDQLQKQNNKLLTRTYPAPKPEPKKPDVKSQDTQTDDKPVLQKSSTIDLKNDFDREMAELAALNKRKTPVNDQSDAGKIDTTTLSPSSTKITDRNNVSTTSPKLSQIQSPPVENIPQLELTNRNAAQLELTNRNAANASSALGENSPVKGDKSADSVKMSPPIYSDPNKRISEMEIETLRSQVVHLFKENKHLVNENTKFEEINKAHLAAITRLNQRYDLVIQELVQDSGNVSKESEDEVLSLKQAISSYQKDLQDERDKNNKERDSHATVFNNLLRDYNSVFEKLKKSTHMKELDTVTAKLLGCEEVIKQNDEKRARSDKKIAQLIREVQNEKERNSYHTAQNKTNLDDFAKYQLKFRDLETERDFYKEQLHLLQMQHQQLLDDHENISRNKLHEIQERHSYTLRQPPPPSSMSYPTPTEAALLSSSHRSNYSSALRSSSRETTQNEEPCPPCPKCDCIFPDMDSLNMHINSCILNEGS